VGPRGARIHFRFGLAGGASTKPAPEASRKQSGAAGESFLTSIGDSFGSRLLLWLPFGFLGIISWSVWVSRRLLTALYRPVVNDHREPASVVAPAYREDPDVLETAVYSWLEAGADEIVLILPEDEPYNVARARAAFEHLRPVRVITTDDPAKRNCLRLGITAATKPIVVLSDSDTVWEPGLLKNLVMPFADPQVGGVGTRQRVIGVKGSVWRRAADWMLDAKYLVYTPAMARKGGVSCLSGRTVAYRRSIAMEVLPDLVDETFFGRHCVSGDDGRLTWLVLNKGYKTTYQSTAVAWTMMPANGHGFLMQRVRWSRNTYRCYLRATFRGWLFKQPMITRVSVLQGMLAPFSLTVGFAFAGFAVVRGDLISLALWSAWIVLGRGIRAIDHLRRNPRSIILLPFMTVNVLFVLTAVKYYTLLTMNKQAWITRREDRGIAEGQAAHTLARPIGAVSVAEAGEGVD
jgi:cellulose synthase/poly-beta-1,6-N-acetylglucosamine synthase-like glycosyltransferase